MKMNALVMVLAVFVSSVAGNVFAGDRYGKQKVVYHINYDVPQAQAGALRIYRIISML